MTKIALVIPSCGGKSFVARLRGYYDLDVGLWPGDAGYICMSLQRSCLTGMVGWDTLLKYQTDCIKFVLSYVPSPSRITLLLHSFAAAEALECDLIYAILPTSGFHRQMINLRGESCARVALLNANTILNEASDRKASVFYYDNSKTLINLTNLVAIHDAPFFDFGAAIERLNSSFLLKV